ncbi:hypothetical protein QEZ54_00075 [Catellatospora sp. KI3]|uniref:hypothetical protein n=1 Tax=Catellatospora sp. KI3 TaxID=3041620 RepID=UPI0024823A32|nr:hypothetical protein [Catellatospora sp. KI3]MDI1459353.1 hypothetical protein [Catellatospora sp. KI3]
MQEALDEAVDALRDYARDWVDRLFQAPNHSDNLGLVEMVTAADDNQIRAWLCGL